MSLSQTIFLALPEGPIKDFARLLVKEVDRIDANKLEDLKSMCHVYLGTNQAVGAGSSLQVIYDTKRYDVLGEYSTTLGRWTPKRAGTYWLSCGAAFVTAQADGDAVKLAIWKNGAEERIFADWALGAAHAPGMSGGDLFEVALSDYFDVRVNASAVGTNIAGGQQYTWFSALRVK